MAIYTCAECNVVLEQSANWGIESCGTHPEADFNTRPHLTEEEQEQIILAARATARMFVEEFNERLDPAKTDWDATAWESEPIRNLINDDDEELAWDLYQKELVSETENLTD